MVRSVASIAIVLGVAHAAFGGSREPGCGGADSPSGGLNAPCTRSKDCSSGLVCAEGVCTDLDAGAPDATSGTNRDAADDGG